ncbi:hypothetical protein GDO81_022432 [Engystomops pustulosus]|uniref:Uncharacterized protein n=1 Tax=Engystomops pustulosus TaxID=76066 RepID=A0AAV6YX29_ENGPU|nr:hypothetical protein GDO81_022432 [Engystomops pustulosus]
MLFGTFCVDVLGLPGPPRVLPQVCIHGNQHLMSALYCAERRKLQLFSKQIVAYTVIAPGDFQATKSALQKKPLCAGARVSVCWSGSIHVLRCACV